MNEYMTKMFPGEEHVCSNVDTAESDGDYVYLSEFLHTLCPSGMPPHRITLKVGMVIMILRNFYQQNGNGSRYLINQILSHLLVATSIVRRRQFPVRPCFAMTVNTSQGQSLHRVGIFCSRDLFSHGRFYVAASRVGRSCRLRIIALDEETKKKHRFLSNVVYEEVLTR